MAHITGTDRAQVLLLPDTVDDYVDPDNPVRFIDAFVDSLDLAGAGFERAEPKETGRPGYDPADLLKLYIYGYLNRVRSSCQSPRYIPHPVTKVIPPFWETSSSRLSLVLLVLVGKTFPNQFPPWKFESPSGPSTSVVLAAGLATD